MGSLSISFQQVRLVFPCWVYSGHDSCDFLIAPFGRGKIRPSSRGRQSRLRMNLEQPPAFIRGKSRGSLSTRMILMKRGRLRRQGLSARGSPKKQRRMTRTNRLRQQTNARNTFWLMYKVNGWSPSTDEE